MIQSSNGLIRNCVLIGGICLLFVRRTVVLSIATIALAHVPCPASCPPTTPSVDDHAIKIKSPSDALALRQRLVDHIWGSPGFPNTKQPTVSTVVEPGPATLGSNIPGLPPLQNLKNLERVEQFVIPMDADVMGLAFHLIPRRKNGAIVVLHHGHACSFDDNDPSVRSDYGMNRTINRLLALQYAVLAETGDRFARVTRNGIRRVPSSSNNSVRTPLV